MTHPRTEALAYRIWAYATPREWNVTGKDIAEVLGIPYWAVGTVLQAKGWHDRTRTHIKDITFRNDGAGGSLYTAELRVLRDMGLDRPHVNE
jgi:hypothetical protein